MRLSEFETKRGKRLAAPAGGRSPAPAGGRSGSGPTACASSARSTAAPPPTSPSRGGASPATRSSARLEALVVAGRGAVYGQAPRGGALRAFLPRGYWRRLAERPALIAVAWLLLLAPGGGGGGWAAGDPGAALGLVPGELQAAADPPAEGRDFDAATGAAFSAQVMFNNIQVTLTAFAGGILAGAGTVSRCSSTG